MVDTLGAEFNKRTKKMLNWDRKEKKKNKKAILLAIDAAKKRWRKTTKCSVPSMNQQTGIGIW